MTIDEWGAGIFAVTLNRQFVFITEDESNPNTRKRAGQISLPMGHLDPGEGALQGALREFGEETDHSLLLDEASIRHVGRILLLKADGRHADITMFAAKVLGQTNGHQTPPVIYANSGEILAMEDKLVRTATKEAITHLLNHNGRLCPWPSSFVFEDLVVG